MTVGSTSLKPLGAEPVKAKAATSEEQAREKAELKKACQMFESQFLKMLWSEMRKTVQQTKMNHGGYGEEVFTDLLDQAVSDESAKNGSVGIADMLERQLSRDAYAHPGAKIGQPLTGSADGNTLQMPVDGAILTSGFGPRQHPVTGEHREHAGLDLAAPAGSPVLAAAAGRVEFAGNKGGYGNLVVITHADGSQTYYGHLEEIAVKEGQMVATGQKVATVGSTGVSTGPHLHFETRNTAGQPVNPLPKLAGAGFNTTT
jgi:murein DD-endopeptidase MepM/ murein hydrolase activator NlpD